MYIQISRRSWLSALCRLLWSVESSSWGGILGGGMCGWMNDGWWKISSPIFTCAVFFIFIRFFSLCYPNWELKKVTYDYCIYLLGIGWRWSQVKRTAIERVISLPVALYPERYVRSVIVLLHFQRWGTCGERCEWFWKESAGLGHCCCCYGAEPEDGAMDNVAGWCPWWRSEIVDGGHDA